MPFDASFNPQRGGAGFGHHRSSSDADDSLWLHHSVNHDAHGCFGARVSWQAETQQQQRTQNLGVHFQGPKHGAAYDESEEEDSEPTLGGI